VFGRQASEIGPVRAKFTGRAGGAVESRCRAAAAQCRHRRTRRGIGSSMNVADGEDIGRSGFAAGIVQLLGESKGGGQGEPISASLA